MRSGDSALCMDEERPGQETESLFRQTGERLSTLVGRPDDHRRSTGPIVRLEMEFESIRGIGAGFEHRSTKVHGSGGARDARLKPKPITMQISRQGPAFRYSPNVDQRAPHWIEEASSVRTRPRELDRNQLQNGKNTRKSLLHYSRESTQYQAARMARRRLANKLTKSLPWWTRESAEATPQIVSESDWRGAAHTHEEWQGPLYLVWMSTSE